MCNRLDWQLDDKAQLATLLGLAGPRLHGREVHPRTWVMPSELDGFLAAWAAAPAGTRFMQKLTWGGRGVGASLLNSSADARRLGEGHIVQQYVHEPLLLPPKGAGHSSSNGRVKFDLRVWATVASLDPLRVYVYNRSYSKTAVVPYSPDGSFHAHFTMTWLPRNGTCAYRSHEDVLQTCDEASGAPGRGEQVQQCTVHSTQCTVRIVRVS